MTWTGVHRTTKKFRYTAAQLDAMPTLSVGQADDLKIERIQSPGIPGPGGLRVWLSRVGVLDGMPYDNQITVEEYQNVGGDWNWVTVDEYPG